MVLKWRQSNRSNFRGGITVMGYQTVAELWQAVQQLFGIQSKVEEAYLKLIFQQTRKGSMPMSEYLRVMKTHADNLALAGCSVPAADLISQVLQGLDEEYNPVTVVAQGNPSITWADLHAMLLAFEKRLEFQNTHKSTILGNHSMANSNSSPSANYVDRRPHSSPSNHSNNSLVTLEEEANEAISPIVVVVGEEMDDETLLIPPLEIISPPQMGNLLLLFVISVIVLGISLRYVIIGMMNLLGNNLHNIELVHLLLISSSFRTRPMLLKTTLAC